MNEQELMRWLDEKTQGGVWAAYELSLIHI